MLAAYIAYDTCSYGTAFKDTTNNNTARFTSKAHLRYGSPIRLRRAYSAHTWALTGVIFEYVDVETNNAKQSILLNDTNLHGHLAVQNSKHNNMITSYGKPISQDMYEEYLIYLKQYIASNIDIPKKKCKQSLTLEQYYDAGSSAGRV